MARILLIERDLELALNIKFWLDAQFHLTLPISDECVATRLLPFCRFDLYVIGLPLQNSSALSMCQEICRCVDSPLIFALFEQETIAEFEQLIDAGLSGYLTKPIDLRELSARLRALLRRAYSYNKRAASRRAGDISIGHLPVDV